VIGDDVGPTLTRDVHDRLAAARFTMINLTQSPPPETKRPADETWVVMRWQGRREARAAWWPTPLVRGTLVVDMDGPKGTGLVTAELDEKPWLSESPTLVRGEHYIVAKSPEPATSEAEARQLAQAAAVDRIIRIVRARAAELGNRSESVPEPVVRTHVQDTIKSRRHMVDECLVRIERPFGPVFFAAEMIDVSTPMVDSVARAALSSVTRDRRSLASMIGAIAGMVLVLAAVYTVAT